MFDFIRKPFLWGAWDKALEKEIGTTGTFHLKSIQDLAVYAQLRGTKGKTIAEIGGGNSRLLPVLAGDNSCYNIEKFEGADGGPDKEVKVPGVENIKVFLGESSDLLKPDFFDILFSVSVVEHVPSPRLESFFQDGLRILKRGGLWLHAIDMYITDEPSAYWKSRYEAYRSWPLDPGLKPEGPVFPGPLKFSCDFATNPDDVMYSWGRIAPSLNELRQAAQSVSLLVAARRV